MNDSLAVTTLAVAETCIQSSEAHDLEEKIKKIFDGETPEKIVHNVMDNYPDQKNKIDSLNAYRQEYSERGMFRKWWNKGEMQEKTSEAVFLLTSMSDSQLKLQALLVWMSNELKKQQDIIASQQLKLKAQNDILIQNQDTLQCQHERLEKQTETLEEQGKTLAEQAERLHRENEELIQRADELRELRDIGKEHDEAIEEHDSALSGMERFLLEFKQVAVEYRKDQNVIREHGSAIADLSRKENTNSANISSIDDSLHKLHSDFSTQNDKISELQNMTVALKKEQDDFSERSQNDIVRYSSQMQDLLKQNMHGKFYWLCVLVWLAVISFVLAFALLK